MPDKSRAANVAQIVMFIVCLPFIAVAALGLLAFAAEALSLLADVLKAVAAVLAAIVAALWPI